MIDLILSILCSTSVLMTFKLLEKHKIKLFHVIIINYVIASFWGVVSNGQSGFFRESGIWQAPWFPLSIVIGICLISIFFVMGISTQKAGMVATTISTRMSVVIPIFFSILFYHEALNSLKVSSVVLALTALVCSIIKKPDSGLQNRYAFLPAILFFGMGWLHVVIKFAQQEYIPYNQSAAFTGTCFFFAFVSGVVISLARRVPFRTFFQKEVMWAGILLGSFNFGTVFFLVNALNHDILDSSVVFGINATGIVASSVLAASVIFKERLLTVNWIGVAFSIVSIILLTNT